MPLNSMRYVYKVLTQDEWEKASIDGYINTALDAMDGFVHFSLAKQLALTIRSYFDQYETLVLLQVETDKLCDRLVFEESGSNERDGKFPHLYGKLDTRDIYKKWNLKRNAFELPLDVLKESENLE
tara:strand:- start:778 stop:1155 length:378 start_codon:yes stop_codon:yes gene_type:complete